MQVFAGAKGSTTNAHVCSCMLTYAHVCSCMLTYAHVCSRMLAAELLEAVAHHLRIKWGSLRQAFSHMSSARQASLVLSLLVHLLY
jgi:hypothetical protein